MNKLLSVTIGGVALILSTGLQASGNVSTQSQSQQLIKDFRANSYSYRHTYGTRPSGTRPSGTQRKGIQNNKGSRTSDRSVESDVFSY